jgi:DNA-binding MarR family transcriptional regulator
MTIEEAIKQKKFASEYAKLAVNILYTASWIDAIHIQNLKPFGISPQQFNVLRILRGANQEPIRLTDITERMVDRNSNATRLVEKLRQKGLLKREICKANRRQVDILITQKGQDLLSEIDIHTEDWMKHLKSLQKTEAQDLNKFLDKLRG